MNASLLPSFCAFLDIFGFREVIARAYSENREAKLLAEVADALSASTGRMKSLKAKFPTFDVKLFTDNIVIGYRHLVNPNLWHLCEVLSDYQLAMACKGFFIRGGVSTGTLAIDEDVVFGDALIKSHHLESVDAKNPRIILDPALKDKIAQSISSASASAMDTWKAHFMCDVDGFWFVNYLSASYEPRSDPKYRRVFYPSEAKLASHRTQVELQLERTRNEPEKWSKYFWVANYHNSFCEPFGMKQLIIAESLLRPRPITL